MFGYRMDTQFVNIIKEDFVRIKEKGDKIWLSTKNEGTLRMYKSAFVEGSWEWCKELFANLVVD